MNGQKSYCTEDYFPQFRIQYHNCHKYSNMSRYHFHEEYEVYYLMFGERYYFVDDKIYHIKSGDMVLINRGTLHRTANAINSTHYERACFYFKKTFPESLGENIRNANLFACFCDSVRILRLNEEQRAFMDVFVKKISNECLNEPEMSRIYIEILLVELLIFINRCFSNAVLQDKEYCNTSYKKISDIITYMNEHYMEDLTLSMLAKRFYMSVSSLTKAFKLATGFSFTQYLNNIRVRHAHNLLDQSSLTISEIAHKVGYSNLTHFERMFKELTGYTPSQYRKTNRFFA